MPILMLIYVPLVWIRNMEKLAFTHLLGNILILVVTFTVMVYGGIEIADNGKAYFNPAFTVSSYKAIPYSAFAFEGVAVVMPLRLIVEDQANFMKLVACVVSGICAFYIIFGEWENLAYGSSMVNNVLITDALPATSPMTYTLKSLYTVNLFFSYPMMMTPAVNLIEGFIFQAGQKPTTSRYWMQNLLRTCVVAFTIALALSVYSYISLFIEVISAATCSPLAFTLPALFHYKLISHKKRHLFIAIATTVLTFCMLGLAINTIVQELSKEPGAE